MKQLPLFSESEAQPGTGPGVIWHLFVDGASRNNPGIAGAGVCILKNEIPAYRRGFFLGKWTNNQAEYLALLVGLFYVRKHINKEDLLIVVSDSELLIKQMKGIYRVKDLCLKQFVEIAKKLLPPVDDSYKFIHVLREKNSEADAMANRGIDKKVSLPVEFIKFMRSYGIEL